ncbi:hypothetical protein T4E_674 [Trichinella pseudospiralis]|uniref:Uncharacterized protein n=1 Tax=Trichinella pseudospiralis TaxID=6337 RepID=A0A0V0XPN8_TRIPS|nr:hypothetical protein T4E_674 [Trichinella pseudospiralis]KRY80812.1 hypothetical protein T4D_3050 [Trichinella pseudospiralis]
MNQGQEMVVMALVSHESEWSDIEAGLYLTKCRPQFLFVKQGLPKDLTQPFLIKRTKHCQ